MAQTFDSTSPQRASIADNAVRHQYRELSEDEKEAMVRVKDAGQALIDEIAVLPFTRETELAVQRAQESVFWAVNSITA